MKLHILSDLHLEFAPFTPDETDADVAILAGDIHLSTHGLGWARTVFPNKEIVYVTGNHEFYRQDWDAHLNALRMEAKKHGIHFLENDEVMIGGVRFLGATLWTDFDLFGEHLRHKAMRTCVEYLADFSQIRISAGAANSDLDDVDRIDLTDIMLSTTRLLTPSLMRSRHLGSRNWLEKKLAEPCEAKTVVVTHHLPALKSVAARYRDSLASAGFASRLEHLMGKSALWVHGHTHDSFDYKIDHTRVICNPRGYARYGGRQIENEMFTPNLVVEV